MLPRDAYFALADEAKKQGLLFAGHVPFRVSVVEASDAGQQSMEHLFGIFAACSSKEPALRDEAITLIDKQGFPSFVRAEIQAEMRALDSYDDKKATALFARMAKNDTWQVPTLIGWRNLSSIDDHRFTHDVRLKYLSSEKQESWKKQRINFLTTLSAEYLKNREKLFQRQLELVRAMHRAGVGIMAGTDTATLYVIPGFSLHEELELLVKAGLSPMAALQAATRNPAKYFGKLDMFGTIETGKVADLVLLEANPLQDISHTQHIAGVMLNGKFLSKAELKTLLHSCSFASIRG
jgi:imidazolonepropionase-like amidohydrolase